MEWESDGGRSLVGYSPWGRKESDMTERLHFIIDIESSDRPEVDVCREMKSMGHKRRSNRQLEIWEMPDLNPAMQWPALNINEMNSVTKEKAKIVILDFQRKTDVRELFFPLILWLRFLYKHLIVPLIMTFGNLNIHRTACILITMHGISLWTKLISQVSYWNRAGPCGPCPSRPPPAFGLWKNVGQRISLIREVRICRQRKTVQPV